MNKLGMVLGLAAIATLAGCKDPDYKRDGARTSQDEVKNVETTAEAKPQPAPIVVEPTPAPAPKAEEKSPAAKPVADLPKQPVEPEYTVYIVQNGDYLAKISKKYNVTISSIKRLNPSIKKDVIRVGQKLKLPGKIDVGVQSKPVVAKAANKPVKRSFTAYTGATKDYVVKNGDTLGSVAYGNGINIRQLKELNGLTSDSLKVGQKLKIPAEKVVRAPAAAKKPVAAKKTVAAKKPVVSSEPKAEAVPQPVEPAAPAVEAAPVVAEPVVAPAEAAAPAAGEAVPAAPAAEAAVPAAPAPALATYVVQEGDDMTSVSIRWGVSAAEVRELNNLSETDQLVPGQIIKLPAEAQQ